MRVQRCDAADGGLGPELAPAGPGDTEAEAER